MNRASTTGATPRRPELDGLRGLAILGVMLFHFVWFSRLRGVAPLKPEHPATAWLEQLLLTGWAGVDLFFVLSGFLITGILADQREKHRYFINFYARRFLRIVPAYCLLLAAWAFVETRIPRNLFGTPDPNYRAWTWSYLSNILIAERGWRAIPLPIQHVWSLAIEEQFYLAWPLVILVLTRRKAIGFCLLLIALCPALRFLLAPEHPLSAYVLTSSRVDSLAIGAALALASREARNGQLPALPIYAIGGGCSVLLATLFLVRGGLSTTDPWVQTLGFSLLSALFASVIGACACQPGPRWLNRALSQKGLCWFGKYSYGLYLYHQPACVLLLTTRAANLVPAFAQTSTYGALLFYFGLPLATSVALALASWYGCERWFLSLKTFFDSTRAPRTQDRAAS